jgi:histidinol dehydrogenase
LIIKKSETEINEAIAVSPELKEAILLAKSNITKFHAAQKTSRVEVETIEGVNCWQEKTDSKVGLYIQEELHLYFLQYLCLPFQLI